MVSKYILQNLNELRRRDKLCDLQLLSKDGKIFSLHKCVFIAACKRQFDIACSKTNAMHTTRLCKMILPQVSSDELKAMISFIYGEPTEEIDRAVLLSALSKLHMLDLLENDNFTPSNPIIKVEPDSPDHVSVLVEVQVSKDSEQQSYVDSAKSTTVEPADFLRDSEVSNPVLDDLDENSDIVLITLKQECEELVNNDSFCTEITTEEDEHIEKLMDQFSNELDLLRTPDQALNVRKVTEDVGATSVSEVEKIKTNLFSAPDKNVDTAFTINAVPDYDSVPKVLCHANVSPKDTSPSVSNSGQMALKIEETNKDTIPDTKLQSQMVLNHTAVHIEGVKTSTDNSLVTFSPRKEAVSKPSSLSKFKMILPAYLLTPNNTTHGPSQNKKILKEFSANFQGAISESSTNKINIHNKNSCGVGPSKMLHKTIAKILALPPLLPSTYIHEKIEENDEKNNDEVADKTENQNSSISAENVTESCETVEDSNNVKLQTEVEKPVAETVLMYEISDSSDSKTDKKQLFRRNVKKHNSCAGYKQKRTITKKKDVLKCVKKKNLDFGTVYKNTTSLPTLNPKADQSNLGLSLSAVAFQNNQPDIDPAYSHSSIMSFTSACSGLSSSSKETVSEKQLCEPDSPAGLSLSEQITIQRNRKRRRKPLQPKKRVEKNECNVKNDEVPTLDDGEELTEGITLLIQSAAEIIGAESECKGSIDKIVADLSVESLQKSSNEGDTYLHHKTSSDVKAITTVKEMETSDKRNATPYLNKNLESALARASPVLVKLLSAVRKTIAVPKSKSSHRKKNARGKTNANKTTKSEPHILNPFSVTNALKLHDVENSPCSAVTVKAVSDTPVYTDNSNFPVQLKNNVLSCGINSPELAKLLARKMEQIGSQKPENSERKTETEDPSPVATLPESVSNNEEIGQSSDKGTESILHNVAHSEKTHSQIMAPVKLEQTKSLSELTEKDFPKRIQRGRPRKLQRPHLSVKELLYIQPKLPHMVLSHNVASKENTEYLEEVERKSKKRHLSVPQVNEYTKKSKNFISMNKQKQKIKRKSLDSLDIATSIQRSVPSKESQISSNNISPDSQCSSAGVTSGKDKPESSISQPVNIAPKPTAKLETLPNPTIIVMGPSNIQPVVHRTLKYYEKPLFTAEQMVGSNLVAQNIVSSEMEAHNDNIGMCKSDKEPYDYKAKCLPSKIILKTPQTYRPIAPKLLDKKPVTPKMSDKQIVVEKSDEK